MTERYKKILPVILAASMIFSTGCSGFMKKDDSAAGKTENAQTAATEEVIASGTERDDAVSEEIQTDAYKEDPDTLNGLPVISGSYNINDCVSIRDMDGIDLEYDGYEEPTYEDARLAILFSRNATLLSSPDVWVEPGDLVNADISAYIDGEYREDISRHSRDIRIGSGSEEKEIEENLLNMYRGTEKEFDKKYGEDDNFLGLSGKTVHYKLKVNSIARAAEPDETTIMQKLEKMKESAAGESEVNRCNAVWEQIMNRIEVKAYPESVVRQARAKYEDEELRGEKLEDYLNRTGITRAEFKKAEDGYAVSTAKEKLAVMLLQDMTGVNEEDDEYKKQVRKTEYNPEDPDAAMKRTLVLKLAEGGE